MLWDVVLLRGSEEVEFTIDRLNKDQRRQVELGVRQLEDFKPKAVTGDRLNEYRLVDPKLVDDFADGLVDTEVKLAEFEESIYVFKNAEESLDEAVKKADKKTEEKAEEEEPVVEDEDLF
jgi:hypothetical protein